MTHHLDSRPAEAAGDLGRPRARRYPASAGAEKTGRPGEAAPYAPAGTGSSHGSAPGMAR
ncbi:hypothetical protein QOM21_29045 [Streptomyces sp. Pv4-95]|uniref:hypothetical protein n=1 Tax=Streptomyces sp. Pv4-95 TaxID=3049543 RepID=UPI00389295E8